MNSSRKDVKYIPALRFGWLTTLYDPILRWTLQEQKFKLQLIQQANIQPGQRVLDLGCGTATLTILLKKMHPEAEVIGLDGDDKALTIAHRKVKARSLEIQLQKGLSYRLDFPASSFDRVVSSLLFHHLSGENKQKTFAEVRRVLKPDGELHLADWGKARNALMRWAFLVVQLLDGFATTTENVQGKLLDYLNQTGFEEVAERQHFSTPFGTLTLYSAVKTNDP